MNSLVYSKILEKFPNPKNQSLNSTLSRQMQSCMWEVPDFNFSEVTGCPIKQLSDFHYSGECQGSTLTSYDILLSGIKQDSFHACIELCQVDINFIHRWLHHMDVGSVANISNAYTASIFRVNICRGGGEFLCIYKFMFSKNHRPVGKNGG